MVVLHVWLLLVRRVRRPSLGLVRKELLLVEVGQGLTHRRKALVGEVDIRKHFLIVRERNFFLQELLVNFAYLGLASAAGISRYGGAPLLNVDQEQF